MTEQKFNKKAIDAIFFSINSFMNLAKLNPYIIRVVMLILLYFTENSELDEWQKNALIKLQLKEKILLETKITAENQQSEEELNNRKEFIVKSSCELADLCNADIDYDNMLDYVNSNLQKEK